METFWSSPAFIDFCCGEAYSIAPDKLGTSCSSVAGYFWCLRFVGEILTELALQPVIPLPKHLRNVLTRTHKSFCNVGPCGDLSTWTRLLNLKPATSGSSTSQSTNQHHNSTAVTNLVALVCDTVSRIRALYPGDVTTIPIGVALDVQSAPVYLLMIIYRPKIASSTFKVAVINASGLGSEFHCYCVEEKLKTGIILRDAILVLRDVIPERLSHSSFWVATYRLLLRPSPLNMHTLYTILLPSLNGKSLMSNWNTVDTSKDVATDFMSFWYCPPVSKKRGSCIHGSFAALQFFLQISEGVSTQDIRIVMSVLIRWGVLLCCNNDVKKLLECGESQVPYQDAPNNTLLKPDGAAFMDALQIKLLRWVIRSFSFCLASELDALNNDKDTPCLFDHNALSIFKETVDWLGSILLSQEAFVQSPKGLRYLAGGGSVPQSLSDIDNGSYTFNHSVLSFPLFDRFRADVQIDTSKLAGDLSPPVLVLPVDLTSVVDVKINSLVDVCTALRNAYEACVLLGNQRHRIRHSYSLRFQLIRHLILGIIPLPLPYSHPHRQECCFWAFQKLRRETKTDLMRLLHAIARHFVTVCFSMPNTRDIDAQRVIVMASICTLMDGVLRAGLEDGELPFPLGAHYSGSACGPVLPFAFDVRFFADQSEFFLLLDPLLNTARAQILDYMNDIHDQVAREDHLLFSFESSKDLTVADRLFLEQICLQYGFSHDKEVLPLYYTGDDPEFSDFVPEYVYLRDTVFYFKGLMNPDASNLPPVRCWTISDATLKWSYNPAKSQFVVRGFQTVLECTGFVKSDYYERRSKTDEGVLTKFLGWFGMATTRTPPSAADPTNLVEKNHRVETEDDVLYLKTLPDFGGRLSVRETEVLLQYLTVPYLRIPLVLQFFCDVQRIDALGGSADLRNVLFATLFEPSLWHPLKTEDDQSSRYAQVPTEVPPKKRSWFGTSLGLLFNELMFAPSMVLMALERLLNVSLEKDPGHIKGSGLGLVLFVTRMTVTVTHFVGFLLSHNDIWRDLNRKSLCGSASLARGLKLPTACSKRALQDTRMRLERRLEQDVLPFLEERALRAVELSDLHMACIIHAHIVYAFKEKLPENKMNLSRFVGSLLFVFIHHRFSLEPRTCDGLSTEKNAPIAGEAQTTSLGVSDMDIFLILENHRRPLIRWFEEHPDDANLILEKALSLVAFTRHIPQMRSWRQLQYFGGKGRIVPIAQAVAAEAIQRKVSAALKTIKQNKNSSESASSLGDAVKHATPAAIKSMLQRVCMSAWSSSSGMDGRPQISHMSLYESWLRAITRPVEDVEFNFQLAEFSLHNNSLELLGPWVNQFPDFTDLFEKVNAEKSIFQCVVVASTYNRYWCRLIGHQHDLQRWESRPECEPLPESTLSYSSSTLLPCEAWVADVLDPWLRCHMPNCQLFIVRDTLLQSSVESHKDSFFESPMKFHRKREDLNFMRFMCIWPCTSQVSTNNDDDTISRSVKELVVTRSPSTITVFNVVECGRALFAVPCYTSSLHLSFCPPFLTAGVNEGKPCDHIEAPRSKQTLSVFRSISGKHTFQQRYIRPCFLKGLIPAYFLAQYIFWQNIHECREDINEYTQTVIYGYSKREGEDEANSSGGDLRLNLLKLTVSPTGALNTTNHPVFNTRGSAVCVLQRFLIPFRVLENAKDASESDISHEILGSEFRSMKYTRISRLHRIVENPSEYGVQEYCLVNLRDVPSKSFFAQLRDSLLRIEDLSYILIWAQKTDTERELFQLTLIELPRLGLSFKAVRCNVSVGVSLFNHGVEDTRGTSCGSAPTSQVRFRCEQHAGLFLTSRVFSRDSLIARLTGEIANGVILENDNGELLVLVDALAMPLVKVASETGLVSRNIQYDAANSGASETSRGLYNVPHYDTVRRLAATSIAPHVVLNRHDVTWIRNLGESRYYLYSVHASQCFLFSPTPASALYLLLLRFLSGNFREVCKTVDATYLFDSQMDIEQKQIWTLLNQLDFQYSCHPDAHATRLKLWLSASRYSSLCCTNPTTTTKAFLNHTVKKLSKTMHTQLPLSKKDIFKNKKVLQDKVVREDRLFSLCSWNLEPDLVGYVKKIAYVSGECRLTLGEELEVLRMFPTFVQSTDLLHNRQTFLQAMIDVRKKRSEVLLDARPPPMLRLPSIPKVDHFDAYRDRTAVDGTYNPTEWIGSLVGMLVPFKRNEEPLTGTAAANFFIKILDRGNSLKLFTDFHFIYELLTEGPLVSNVSVIPAESSYYWGALFSRFLSPWEYQTQSQLMSLIRIILANPHIVPVWPRLKEEKRQKIPIALMLRSQEGLQRFLKELLSIVQERERTKELRWPPKEVTLDKPACAPQHPSNSHFHLVQRLIVTNISRNTSCDCRFICPVDLHQYNVLFPMSPLESVDSDMIPAVDSCCIKNFSCCPLAEYINVEKLVTCSISNTPPLNTQSASMLISGLSVKPLCHTHVGLSNLERFTNDLRLYEHQMANQHELELEFLSKARIRETLTFQERTLQALSDLKELSATLSKAYLKDSAYIETTIRYLEQLANIPILQKPNDSETVTLRKREWAFVFYKTSMFEPYITVDTLIELLISTTGQEELQLFNPFLMESAIKDIFSLSAILLLVVNRRNQLCQTLQHVLSLEEEILSAQNKKQSTTNKEWLEHSVVAVRLKMEALASILNTRRHYMELNPQSVAVYDPRFLAFEFAYNIILRKEQIELTQSFMEAVTKKVSVCHQAVMGAGKTTVVAPLLSILLADKADLVVQVVPQSLLEFTKTVFQERFSAIIKKGVMTFSFSRYQSVTPQLVSAFIQTKEKKNVCISTPCHLKSIFLKVIQLFSVLDASTHEEQTPLTTVSSVPNTYEMLYSTMTRMFSLSNTFRHRKTKGTSLSNEELRSLRRELDLSLRILELFKSSILLLDEVDMILHPLKSELHWPIGGRQPLDFTEQIGSAQDSVETDEGLRWRIPWHLMEPIFFIQYESSDQRLSLPLGTSREAARILEDFQKEVQNGIEMHYLQKTPHLVLSDVEYYHKRLKVLLARWLYINLRAFRYHGLGGSETIQLLCLPVDSTVAEGDVLTDQLIRDAEEKLSETSRRMLNLSRQWLNGLLPHVLQKVNRVGYGLLNETELVDQLLINASMPNTRQCLAIPFVGKDTPSLTSEFSHPDIVIGFSIMAYRYSGLRYEDFLIVLNNKMQQLSDESGALHKRPSAVEFSTWVAVAGGRIRHMRDNIKDDDNKEDDTEDNTISSSRYNDMHLYFLHSSTEQHTSRPHIPDVPDSLESNQNSCPDITAPYSVLDACSIRRRRRTFPVPPNVENYGGVETTTETEALLFQKVWPLEFLNLKGEDHEEKMHILYRLLWKEPLVIKSFLLTIVFPLTLQHCSSQFSASAQELGSSMLFPTRLGFSGTPNALLPLELNETVYQPGIYGKIIHLLTSPSIVSIECMTDKWTVDGFLEAFNSDFHITVVYLVEHSHVLFSHVLSMHTHVSLINRIRHPKWWMQR